MKKLNVESLLVAAALTGLAVGGANLVSKAQAGSLDGKMIAKKDHNSCKGKKKDKCKSKDGCEHKDDKSHDGAGDAEGGDHAE